MRLARFGDPDSPRVGVVVGDDVVDVTAVGVSDDPVALLGAGPDAWAAAVEAATASEARTPLADVTLLAPVPRPSTFFGVGMNTRDHLAEIQEGTSARAEASRARMALLRQAFPEPRFPTLFTKQIGAPTGPGSAIWLPKGSVYLDYEGEVVVVIGRRTRHADEAEAAEAIAGYTAGNDVSVRDWQTTTSQMWLGKSYETHGPIGPWVVTRDEFDPAEATIRTWVDSELRQKGHLIDQIHSPAELVSRISEFCTLEPGDLVATGTPAGVGAFREEWLTIGDRVQVEIGGIGILENVVTVGPG